MGSRGVVVKTLPKKDDEPTIQVVQLDDCMGVYEVPIACTISEIVYDKLDLSPIC
jgi:hypothetical protein